MPQTGIGFVAYSPLGRSFLTGQFRTPEDLPEEDVRRNHPRFQGENFAKNLRLVDEIGRIAQERGVTPAQLALAWVLAQRDDIVPIRGTRRRSSLDQNLDALDVALDAQALARSCQTNSNPSLQHVGWALGSLFSRRAPATQPAPPRVVPCRWGG